MGHKPTQVQPNGEWAEMKSEFCQNEATMYFIIKSSSVLGEEDYFACCDDCFKQFSIYMEFIEVSKEEFIVGQIMNS